MAMDPEALDRLLAEMSSPDLDVEYYAVTLTADQTGRIQFTTQTEWVGFADEDCRVEIRRPSLVHPDRVMRAWDQVGVPGCAVWKEDHMMIFLQIGGNAVVEAALAHDYFQHSLVEGPSRMAGRAGFKSASDLDPTAFNRAPTKSLRMKIIKRDNFRCFICGRRPTDHVDVELHVHHIRPWADRGLTIDDNLVTLCKTCHDGLKPHFEMKLFELTGQSPTVEQHAREHISGVTQYQRVVASRGDGS